MGWFPSVSRKRAVSWWCRSGVLCLVLGSPLLGVIMHYCSVLFCIMARIISPVCIERISAKSHFFFSFSVAFSTSSSGVLCGMACPYGTCSRRATPRRKRCEGGLRGGAPAAGCGARSDGQPGSPTCQLRRGRIDFEAGFQIQQVHALSARPNNTCTWLPNCRLLMQQLSEGWLSTIGGSCRLRALGTTLSTRRRRPIHSTST